MRCYICDVSPGNQSLYRISTTRPTLRSEGPGWICSECESQDDGLDVVDIILTEEDLSEPKEPPTEKTDDKNKRSCL